VLLASQAAGRPEVVTRFAQVVSVYSLALELVSALLLALELVVLKAPRVLVDAERSLVPLGLLMLSGPLARSVALALPILFGPRARSVGLGLPMLSGPQARSALRRVLRIHCSIGCVSLSASEQ